MTTLDHPDQTKLFGKLPFQQTPDVAVRYAESLGPDKHPRQARAVIREAACRHILDEVIAWMGPDAEGRRESVLADLMAHVDSDGYAFARSLERANWVGVDSDLVDILNGYFAAHASIEREMIEAWVKANAIALDLAAGARVVDMRPSADFKRPDGSPRTGTIVDTRPTTADYVVQFDGETANHGNRGGEILRPDQLQALSG